MIGAESKCEICRAVAPTTTAAGLAACERCAGAEGDLEAVRTILPRALVLMLRPPFDRKAS